MQAVVLTIHLLLALTLIIVVLLQRSEGGGLGIGGGGVMTSRGAATALSKVTWAVGMGFVVTSLVLTVLAARDSGTGSVIDGGLIESPGPAAPAAPGLEGDLLPQQLPAQPEAAQPAAAGRRRAGGSAARPVGSDRGNFSLPPLVRPQDVARRLAGGARFPYRLSPVKPRLFQNHN